ncbi:MAG: FAD-dependent oxidoreductase [Clostridiales bacterium]|nr:FAD-dependent oxidoreductase [Clostridiales bacterium]
MKTQLKTIVHEADLCVVGGGIGGMFTAISAARHGAKVVLMQDRPVLGGNCSSEIRMWISGAGTRVRDLQETGIMEEILLENMHRNPRRNFTTWDALLYEKVKFEENIELLLNCACCDAETENDHINSVTGFQLTTYTWHQVKAKIFADCSGDSILAPLTGAEYKVGREAKAEYNEEFGLESADPHTMGMSLMIQCRETDHPISYTPPAWAYDFPDDDAMNNKPHNLYAMNTNFYWVELGGMQDSIADTEEVRDELLKIAFGAWDHIKNHGDHGAENWDLEWVGFLPGKRESRRYVGDYVMTQHDVENCTPFHDTVAYGGWQIDNHLPGGFHMNAKGGAHLQKRRLSEPYPIPFRSLYSKNIDNLMFAGRNISASHIAFSTTRVMGTIGVIGQAAGTGAAIAVKYGLNPRQACEQKIEEIQDALLEDDCFLPGLRRKIAPLSKKAALTCDYGDCSLLINGLDRRIWGLDNGYFGKTNKAITYTFDQPEYVEGFRLVLDSDLNRECTEGNPDGLNTSTVLFFAYSHNQTTFGFPQTLVKHYRIEAQSEDGQWQVVYEEKENHQRFIKEKLGITAKAVRFIPLTTYSSERKNEDYGSSSAHLFNFEVF